MKTANKGLKSFRTDLSETAGRIIAIAMLLAAYLLVPSADANSQVVPLNIDIEVKAAVQGYFNPDSREMTNDCEVEISLHDAIDPGLVHASKTVTLNKSTLTARVQFSRIYVPECYIAIKSSNSLRTFSKEPVVLSRNELNTYDFTSAKDQAYGSNMFEYDFGGPKVACIYIGDVDSDGIVDGTDFALVENDAFNYVFGNTLTDLTGEGFVDGTDLAIVEANTANYVISMTPPGSVAATTSAQEQNEVAELSQNYPNPFNPSTVIAFNLRSDASVKLSVFDMSGREVAVLADQNLKAGSHSYKWNAMQLSSGTYFYRLNVNGVQTVKQMQLIK